LRFKIGYSRLKIQVSPGYVANPATNKDRNTSRAQIKQLLTKPKKSLQKMQIGVLLKQNSIINGLCVVVVWHYQKQMI